MKKSFCIMVILLLLISTFATIFSVKAETVVKINTVPLIGQETANSCWDACSIMVLKYYGFYGPDVSQLQLARELEHEDWYYSTGFMNNALEGLVGTWEHGLERLGKVDVDLEWTVTEGGLTFDEIISDINLNNPIIALMGGTPGHTVVIVGYIDNSGEDNDYVTLNDPDIGSGVYPNSGVTWNEPWSSFKNRLVVHPVLGAIAPFPQALRFKEKVEKNAISIHVSESSASGVVKFEISSSATNDWLIDVNKWDTTANSWSFNPIPGTSFHKQPGEIQIVDVNLETYGRGNYKLGLSASTFEETTWNVNIEHFQGRSGDSDSFGYTFKDSNAQSGPSYNWIEISNAGTEILPNYDDQWVSNIDLGFFFNYYGTDYSQLAIGNNGLLFSGAGTSKYVNDPITQSPTIHGFISAFWDDIVTWNTAGTIYYQTFGTIPNRQFVVEWYDNQHYYSSSSGITFEAILYEGTNNILFQYKDVSFGTVTGAVSGDLAPYDNGGSATVGIEDPGGNIGLQYSYNEQVITPGLAILFKFPQFSGTNMHLSVNAPSSMDHGNTMTYSLYYRNFGSTTAQNVQLKATLSPNVVFSSASLGGAYDSATRTVTWNIGTVSEFPSGIGSQTVTATIPSNIPVGTTIQTSASITTTALEVRYDDNTANAQTSVTGSGLPPNVGVGPIIGTVGGTPSIYYSTPTTFTYTDSSATSVDIRIHLDDGGSDYLGTMTEGPSIWTYSVTFYPRYGHATVTYTTHYPSSTSQETFNIYVDPAGYVYNAVTNQRISGAQVWLQQPDGQGGWENVAIGANPANMIPDSNPLVTDANGQYQWDTLPGTYRVHVEAIGFYPADSIVVNVPPPVTDLHVALTPYPQEDLVDWPMFRSDLSHTGVGTGGSVTSPTLVWKFLTYLSVESSPAVVSGVLYVGSVDGNVYALDASNGAKIWNYSTGSSIYSSPAVINNIVYIGAWNDGNVYALDASNGAKIWNYSTGSTIDSSPAIANGVLYIGAWDGNVYALDASNGAKIWNYSTGGRTHSSPSVSNGVVYVGSADGNVYALDASNGAKIWNYSTGSYVRSSPAVANGVVYVGSYDGNVYALNVSNGALIWYYPTGGFIYSSPAIANGIVYIGSNDTSVHALSASTGLKLWNYSTGDGLHSSPTVVNGMIYFGSHDYNVYAISSVDHFVISPVSSQVAGTSFGVTATAVNSQGLTLTAYNGNPAISCSSGPVNPSVAQGFTNGIWSDSVTINTAGSGVTLSVNDGNGHSGVSNAFTITHTSAPSSIAISPLNTAITAGSTVTYSSIAYDSYGNSWSATSATTWSISNGAEGSWLNSVYSSAVAGSWVITGTLGSVSKNTALTVNPGNLHHFVISCPPTVSAQSPFTLTITAKDAFGNTLPNYQGSLSLSASSGSISPSTTGISGWSNGVWISSAITLNQAGQVSVTSSDGSGHTGLTSVSVLTQPTPTPTATSTITPGPTIAPTTQNPTPSPTDKPTISPSNNPTTKPSPSLLPKPTATSTASPTPSLPLTATPLYLYAAAILIISIISISIGIALAIKRRKMYNLPPPPPPID